MMKNSIKVDFCDRTGKGIEPIIRVFIDGTSDDPRDALLKTLFQSTNDYLQIEYTNHKHVTNAAGLPEMEKTLILFKPGNIEKLESPFVSRYLIDDEVSFATKEACDVAWEDAKKKNPDKPESEIEWEPEYKWGKIVAVTFTPAKVYYNIVDDYSGNVYRDIPSHYVKNLAKYMQPVN